MAAPVATAVANGLANIELRALGSIRVVSAIKDVRLVRKTRLATVPRQRPIAVSVSPFRSTKLRISDR